MLRSRYVGALALVLLTTLAGCASAEKPDAAPPPPKVSASPPPSPSTPPAPVMPEAAKADTKAGAVAFVKWYVELINHAQATGDVALLRLASSPECTSCAKASRQLEDIYREGGHIEGGTWTVDRIFATPADASWLVSAAMTATPQTLVTQTSKPFPGGRHTYTFRVTHGTNPRVVEWSRIA